MAKNTFVAEVTFNRDNVDDSEIALDDFNDFAKSGSLSTLTKKLLLSCFWDFLQLRNGCPKANFGPMLRGQPYCLDDNHCILSNFTA